MKTSVEVLSKIASPSPRVAVAGVAAVSQPAMHDKKRTKRDVLCDIVETWKLLSSLRSESTKMEETLDIKHQIDIVKTSVQQYIDELNNLNREKWDAMNRKQKAELFGTNSTS